MIRGAIAAPADSPIRRWRWGADDSYFIPATEADFANYRRFYDSAPALLR